MNKYDRLYKECREAPQAEYPEIEVIEIGWGTVLSLTVFAVLVTTLLLSCVTEAERQPALTSTDVYETFFTIHKSPVPAVMTGAIQAVKPHNRPILAAVAVAESNGTPWAIGDKGASRGAFQVKSKYWGIVSSDVVEQALQAERILEELLRSRLRWRDTLAAYNGGTNPPTVSFRYADRVARLERSLR